MPSHPCLLSCPAGTCTGIEYNTSKTYVFTSRSTGPSLVLAVSDDSSDNSTPTLAMANATEAGGAGQWFLTRVNGNQPGVFYRVHAASLGVGQSIDVVNQGGAVTSTELKMAASGDSSGQAWRFDQWTTQESDGYRLSNKLTGPDMHLDVTDSLDAHLFGGDFAGQHWTLASAGDSTAAEDGGSGDGPLLSTAGIAGLAVVAALGLGLAFFGSLYCLLRSRRRRRKQSSPVELGVDALERKASVQSSQSRQSYGLHELQTAQPSVASHPESETVSPASTYQQGTINIGMIMSDTSLQEALKKTGGPPPPEPMAELPDKRY